jgi:hypothetical protein
LHVVIGTTSGNPVMERDPERSHAAIYRAIGATRRRRCPSSSRPEPVFPAPLQRHQTFV